MTRAPTNKRKDRGGLRDSSAAQPETNWGHHTYSAHVCMPSCDSLDHGLTRLLTSPIYTAAGNVHLRPSFPRHAKKHHCVPLVHIGLADTHLIELDFPIRTTRAWLSSTQLIRAWLSGTPVLRAWRDVHSRLRAPPCAWPLRGGDGLRYHASAKGAVSPFIARRSSYPATVLPPHHQTIRPSGHALTGYPALENLKPRFSSFNMQRRRT